MTVAATWAGICYVFLWKPMDVQVSIHHLLETFLVVLGWPSVYEMASISFLVFPENKNVELWIGSLVMSKCFSSYVSEGLENIYIIDDACFLYLNILHPFHHPPSLAANKVVVFLPWRFESHQFLIVLGYISSILNHHFNDILNKVIERSFLMW